MGYLSFYEARKVVWNKRLHNVKQWKEYCKSGKKPDDIPASPESVYKDYWRGWIDWLGTQKKISFKGKYRSFEAARKYVRSLGLKNQKEWVNYSKSQNKPDDIPAGPNRVYKNKGWINFGDWLGTGTIANQYREYYPFHKARKLVHSLGLKSREEWRKFTISGKKPETLPSNPAKTYKNYWKGFGDWLGTGTIAVTKRQFRSFEEARKFTRLLNLKSQNQWQEYCKLNKLPLDIPTSPRRTYKTKWKGWGDWLGTGNIARQDREYRSFEDARKFVHAQGLKNRWEWEEYCKSGKKPEDIPYQGRETYKQLWKGWGDWLGTKTIATFKRQFKSFDEARKFVHQLNFKNQDEWRTYSKSGNKPQDIPSNPARTYKKHWKDFGDWLGTGKTRDFRSFEQARKYVHTLGLKNRSDWAKFAISTGKPGDIPADPSYVYDEWKGIGDWLGTGTIAPQNRIYLPFTEARQFVRSLGLRNQFEWRAYTKSNKKPTEIPANPAEVYDNHWIDWFDWIGVKNIDWTVKKIKELLKDLISSKIIYEWDEAVLYSLLLRKGLLNMSGNRHESFFKNLIQASRSENGRYTIEEYVNSNSKIPPDLSEFAHNNIEDSANEIQKASTDEIKKIVENTDPLYYDKNESVEQILVNTDILESINVDEEAIQFYVNYSIDELWKLAFRDEIETIRKIRIAGKNGNKYHDTVIDTFLKDYEGVKGLEIPTGYSFSNPNLMQLYVAYKVKQLPYFGNFSGTGAGKTLSAILASRVLESKMTIIVCPNDVVEQWRRSILEVFPNSQITIGRDAFYVQNNEKIYQYQVLNYDKFSQEYSPNLILQLAKQKIDFVILDEIHFTKIRDEEKISQRRVNLDGLMTAIRKKNRDVKVLGLSATPVVNNLREGRSLLELITGKIYDDVATKSTIPNAVTLYEKLSTISIRQIPDYNVKTNTHFIDVEAQKPIDLSIKQAKSNPLAIEKILTNARLPEIIKNIQGQTIIYTEYVEDIIQKISAALVQEGYSYALYTGIDKSGLERFRNEKVQVLLASRPISVGVDKLQHICNRLIINTLPWTNAQYQQLLGRLVRMGQIKSVVNIYVIKASIAGYQYDEIKWKRIQFKRTLADCAVDGRLPEKNLVTPQQAAMEAIKWLERLERGEVSTVVRRDLNVELSPVEIKKRVIKYGDFTRLNNKINTENSDTTHHRMTQEPKEWEEYHRQYREARKTWSIIPYEEIIKRIKQLSPRLLIGDFGCGEAKILEAFGAERVESFDHIAINNKVTACDMKSVPLPDEGIDIAVFSLSLMGKNWPDYIAEAKRCLATGGYLLIIETTKTIKGRLSNIRDLIKKHGFEIFTDEERGDFTFLEAREF